MNAADLWRQMLAAPGDESLKAQYVEALTQAGEARATIFSAAAELKKYPRYYVQHDALKQQYQSLLMPWQEELAAPSQVWQAQVLFNDGWPNEITISAKCFGQHGAAIIATMPLRHLNLTAVREAPEVFQSPPFNQIASLKGSQQPWTTEAITALANSPHLSSLRWLDLSNTGLSEEQVEILAASPQLRNVEHLDLSNNPARDPVDAAAGNGSDEYGHIVWESVYLPDFGRKLEARHGRIEWLHALEHFMEEHPPHRYGF